MRGGGGIGSDWSHSQHCQAFPVSCTCAFDAVCNGVLMFGFVHVLLRIISRVLVDRVFSAVGVGGLIATGYGG